MYHSISDDVVEAIHPYFETSTPPEVFELHLRYLQDNGYSAIDIAQLDGILTGRSSVSRPVMITFDDGYADFDREAFPILEKYGFKAIVFLATAFIMEGRCGKFRHKEMLRWEDVKLLRKYGTVFGSHTVNHPVLKNLGTDEMESELVLSKKHIEDHLEESVEIFSCPFAFPQENSAFKIKYESLLKRAGYRYGVTTVIGRVSAENYSLQMRRLPVNRYDDLALFAAKLEGGYDWLQIAQYGVRVLRNWF